MNAPMEINSSSREQLLQIPGIGPMGANSILKARRVRKIKSLGDLQKLGISSKRAKPFILLDGSQPDYQYKLF